MTDHDLFEYTRQAQHQATLQLLSQGNPTQTLNALVTRTQHFTIELMTTVAQKTETVACQTGCCFCCYLLATVSAPEALTIATQLRQNCTPAELSEIKEKIAQAYAQTDALNNLERIQAHLPCPLLLTDGTCRIYSYRPLDCITYHSLDKAACEQLLATPEAGHPTNLALQQISIGIKAGLGQGLADAKVENPALRYELIEALHLALNDDQALEKYAQGENIFLPAAITIDPDKGISYKIKCAPPHLKAQAKRVLSLGRRAQKKK